MALAAAALSANGERPSPQLATSVNTPLLGWVVLPGGTPTFMFPPASIAEATGLLAVADSPFWQVLASGFTPDGPITWYISGTRASAWQGTPLTLVLVLEEDNPKTGANDWRTNSAFYHSALIRSVLPIAGSTVLYCC
jgi:hypothetical protein